MYHKVTYTKQQLSSNNQVCRFNSVRAVVNSKQGPIKYEHRRDCVLLPENKLNNAQFYF